MEPEEVTPDSNAHKQTIYVIVEYQTAAALAEHNRPYTLLSAINYNQVTPMLTLPVPELQTQLQQHFFHDHYRNSTFDICSLKNHAVSTGNSAKDHLNIAMLTWKEFQDYQYGKALVKGAANDKAAARAYVLAHVKKESGPQCQAFQVSDDYIRMRVETLDPEVPMMLHWYVERLKYDPSSVVVLEQGMYLPV